MDSPQQHTPKALAKNSDNHFSMEDLDLEATLREIENLGKEIEETIELSQKNETVKTKVEDLMEDMNSESSGTVIIHEN